MKKLVLTTLSGLLLMISIHCQENPDQNKIKNSNNTQFESNEYCIVLKNRIDQRQVIFRQGKKIKLILKENQIVKGNIDSIAMANLHINGRAININDIQRLKYQKEKTKNTGTTLLLIGGMTTIGGLILGLTAANDEVDSLGESLDNAGQVGGGYLLSIVGIGLMATGATMIVVKDNYDLVNDWEIKTEQIAID